MSAARGRVLYTPELLALAVSLADRPFDPAMALSGEARSRTCGSTLRLSCRTDKAGRIAEFGLQVTACAVGQAAAAIFAANAEGYGLEELAASRSAVEAWLAGTAETPDWPGVDALDPARAYAARHGAILLAWDAALAALSNAKAVG
ncbi:iron-sulfur cluster assembly scaffold protein [Tsuneonella sp. HG249]